MKISRRALLLAGLVIAASWAALVVYGPSCPLCKPQTGSFGIEEIPKDLDAPNPLPLTPTLELERMTWMEVRDRVKDGARRVIVPTGGIEQNGPFVALNKHDLIARAVSVQVAELLGNTIVAPTISFVPEGSFNPPSGHMRYPGTISLSSDTFQRLLNDIITSLSLAGFTEIVVVGDSLDSQADIVRAVTQRTPENTNGSRVRYLSDFYNYDEVRAFLKEQGIEARPEQFHEELAFTLQLMAIEPEAARYEERLRSGGERLGGLSLGDKAELTKLGREILRRRVERIAAAIREGR
jgi:creatinine amidohydrolase/Fe(II)-dependent formamide hydrolase-like protein